MNYRPLNERCRRGQRPLLVASSTVAIEADPLVLGEDGPNEDISDPLIESEIESASVDVEGEIKKSTGQASRQTWARHFMWVLPALGVFVIPSLAIWLGMFHHSDSADERNRMRCRRKGKKFTPDHSHLEQGICEAGLDGVAQGRSFFCRMFYSTMPIVWAILSATLAVLVIPGIHLPDWAAKLLSVILGLACCVALIPFFGFLRAIQYRMDRLEADRINRGIPERVKKSKTEHLYEVFDVDYTRECLILFFLSLVTLSSAIAAASTKNRVVPAFFGIGIGVGLLASAIWHET